MISYIGCSRLDKLGDEENIQPLNNGPCFEGCEVSQTSRNAAFSGSCSGGALIQREGRILRGPQTIVAPIPPSNCNTRPVVLLRPSRTSLFSLALAAEDSMRRRAITYGPIRTA